MEKTLSEAQSEILDIVRANDRLSIASIANRVGLADPSVRRDIQTLRKQGHNIVCNHDGDQWGGPTYTYIAPAVQAAQVVNAGADFINR